MRRTLPPTTLSHAVLTDFAIKSGLTYVYLHDLLAAHMILSVHFEIYHLSSLDTCVKLGHQSIVRSLVRYNCRGSLLWLVSNGEQVVHVITRLPIGSSSVNRPPSCPDNYFTILSHRMLWTNKGRLNSLGSLLKK